MDKMMQSDIDVRHWRRAKNHEDSRWLEKRVEIIRLGKSHRKGKD